MTKGECPCRYCVPPDRTPTCHSTCKEYKDYRKELDKTNADIKHKKIWVR